MQQRLTRLSESGEIIGSMKNLAFMETRKLARLIEHQRGVIGQIEAVAADFLAFFPETLPAMPSAHHIYLVVGSRRGFCGDFNERLVEELQRKTAAAGTARLTVIGVGQKLCRRLGAKYELDSAIEGADVAEEIPSVLGTIVDRLESQRQRRGALQLSVVYQDAEEGIPCVVRMLPPFEDQRGAPRQHENAPLLNLPARTFLLALGEQYLFAALHGVLFESLLAENDRRLRHLDGALRHLEQRVAGIRRHVQALRQEEIIEEIEVILLNAADLDASVGSPLSPDAD
ncbi:MAG: F0F1 ATP synthase subunit gamma [Chromatiaceae bacterium]|jgi:F-type H+-transporting ATPase subunit gamma